MYIGVYILSQITLIEVEYPISVAMRFDHIVVSSFV